MNNSPEGIVVSSKRRFATILNLNNSLVIAKVGAKVPEIVVGDRVTYQAEGDQFYISNLISKKNCLTRSYRGQTKKIAANVDHLFIVSAVVPLFNTNFIDRISVVAGSQNIPVSLVVNKIDLGIAQTEPLIEIYRKIGMQVLLVCSKFGQGMQQLLDVLDSSKLKIVALSGVSGVGKSTILNHLIPAAARATSEVSQKTGQGRQTTSLAEGHFYCRNNKEGLVLIDLPGIQSFGVSDLTAQQIAAEFPEITQVSSQCQFSNCSHQAEPKCGVKTALQKNLIAESRYKSYLGMLAELEAAKEY